MEYSKDIMITNFLFVVLILFLCCYGEIFCKTRKTLEELTNTCIRGGIHKSKPTPQFDLAHSCKQWRHRSCCTGETSTKIHSSPSGSRFNIDHCGTLSFRCRKHFLQDLCFYECSPNVGPWLVRFRAVNERYVNVPLCSTDCNNWWNDCKEDLTCVQDWFNDFKWITGRNTCPIGSTCKEFSQIYNSASHFCETVWNHSWKIVPDTASCMRLWFDASDGNPNDAVAMARAMETTGISSSIPLRFSSIQFCHWLCIVQLVNILIH